MLIFLEITSHVAVSTKVFGTPTIIARNCTHISVQSVIMPDQEGFEYTWAIVTFNSSSNTTVRSIFFAVCSSCIKLYCFFKFK